MPPAATVKFGTEEKTYPCDIDLSLPAYGLADWRAEAYAQREPGERGVVRVETLLGVFEGEVIVTSVEADMVHGITSRLVGVGMLRPVEAQTTFIGPTT
jgi:hypothetical protein